MLRCSTFFGHPGPSKTLSPAASELLRLLPPSAVPRPLLFLECAQQLKRAKSCWPCDGAKGDRRWHENEKRIRQRSCFAVHDCGGARADGHSSLQHTTAGLSCQKRLAAIRDMVLWEERFASACLKTPRRSAAPLSQLCARLRSKLSFYRNLEPQTSATNYTRKQLCATRAPQPWIRAYMRWWP